VLNIVLQKPNHQPSRLSKFFGNYFVPGDISGDLLFPKFHIAPRHNKMLGAGVPVTSVNKYNYLRRVKGQIGLLAPVEF